MASATKTKLKWTEGRVFKLLEKIFPSPAYTLLSQVRNGTGYARRTVRTADAIAVSTWPSRGMYLTGVEIKVSPSDWRRELAQADKSAEIQSYCRYWYVAAPVGIVPVGELPETWGLIECDGAKASVIKAAPQLEAKEVDMLLLCSILRRMAEVTTPTAMVDEQIQARLDEAEKSWQAREDYATRHMKECVEAFQQASGIDISNQWDAGHIGEAVKLVRECGLMKIRNEAKNLRREAAYIVERLDKAIVGIGASKSQGDGEEDEL